MQETKHTASDVAGLLNRCAHVTQLLVNMPSHVNINGVVCTQIVQCLNDVTFLPTIHNMHCIASFESKGCFF